MTDLTTAAGLAAHYSEVSRRLNPRSPPPAMDRPRRVIPFQTWPPRTPPSMKLPYVVGMIEPDRLVHRRAPSTIRDVISVSSLAAPLIAMAIEFPVVPSAFHWKVVLAEVSKKHGITVNELIGQQRSSQIVAARHESMWRMKTETTMSLPEIGRRLGNRDHTTVLHGVRKYAAKLHAAGLLERA